MYRKVSLFPSSEKFLIQASGKHLTTHKIATKIETCKSKHFDYPIKYLEVFQDSSVLIITENFEFSILNPDLQVLYQGKFLVQKPFPTVIGCVYQSKTQSILLNFKSNSLTSLSLHPRPIHYSLPINDEVHWPSSFSQILKISLLRGDNSLDFAGRQMFCFLVQFSDHSSVHCASLDEYNKELIPGPWAIRFLPCTVQILSVHNTIIGFTDTKIFQFQILKEKMIEIPSESVTSVMEYSDKCNRILCAAYNKLIWLHVSPDSIKISPAAVLPIDSSIDQLLNLNTSNTLSVFCYSIKGESIAIGINLKNMTVAEILRWQGSNFWPEVFVQHRFGVFMSGHKKLRVFQSLWGIFAPSNNLFGEKIFRVSEDAFLITGSGFSSLINSQNLGVIDSKDLVTRQKTLCFQKYGNKTVQVTTGMINLLNFGQCGLDDSAGFALVVFGFIIVGLVDTLVVYKDLQVVRRIWMDGEILSVCEKDKGVVVAVKDLGLFWFCLEKMVLKKFELNLQIFPQFYYYGGGLEVVSNSEKTFVVWENCVKELEFGVVRVSLVKEAVQFCKFFLQGFENCYVMSVPGWKVFRVDFFDAICLYENTFLAAYSDKCCVGQIENMKKVKSVKVLENISAIAVDFYGIYAFSSGMLTIFNHQLQEMSKVALQNLEFVKAALFFKEFLVIASENHAYFLGFQSFYIEKEIQTSDPIMSLSKSENFLIIFLQFSVLVYNDFSLCGEVKFMNPEYEELGKKLDSDDLESIIQLKLSEKFQKIVGFAFVNNGRNEIERIELEKKECVCVTAKGVYWGILDNGFKQLSQRKFDFDCICSSISSTSIYTLHYDHFCVFELEIADSLMILMNSGYVDWRIYKINLSKKIQTLEGVFLSVNDKEIIVFAADGETQIYELDFSNPN